MFNTKAAHGKLGRGMVEPIKNVYYKEQRHKMSQYIRYTAASTSVTGISTHGYCKISCISVMQQFFYLLLHIQTRMKTGNRLVY